MASGDETDLSPLGTRCLSLSRLLASQGRAFSLKLTIGHQFSFCADSKGMRSVPARGSPDGNWTRKKSPSAIRRDRRRRNEFLKRKDPSISPATSKLDNPSSSDLPVQPGVRRKPWAPTTPLRRAGAAWTDTTVTVHTMMTRGRIPPMKQSGKESGWIGVKELGRQVREGLDEIGQLQQQLS